MDSADFFVIVSGAYKDADEAFKKAVKNARSKNGDGGNTGNIAEKEYFKVLEVPRGKDPLAFAKKRAGDHGNHFWTYNDGPAACVEIKGVWLKRNLPENVKKVRGLKMFVFFGSAYLNG